MVGSNPPSSSLWAGNWGWALLSYSGLRCTLKSLQSAARQQGSSASGIWLLGDRGDLGHKSFLVKLASLGLFIWQKQCSERKRDRTLALLRHRLKTSTSSPCCVQLAKASPIPPNPDSGSGEMDSISWWKETQSLQGRRVMVDSFANSLPSLYLIGLS